MIHLKINIAKLGRESFNLDLTDTKGEILRIADLKGKVVMLDFWATWCSTCIEYMPEIKKVYDEYHHKGFEVVPVSIDKENNKSQVLKIEERLGLSWQISIIGDLPLNAGIWKKYGFLSVPQLILLDKNGKLILNNGILRNPSGLSEQVKAALIK